MNDLQGRDPFNQSSNRSDREKWSTSKGGPVVSKLFRLDRTDPLVFGPKFPKMLVEWIAPKLPKMKPLDTFKMDAKSTNLMEHLQRSRPADQVSLHCIDLKQRNDKGDSTMKPVLR